MTSEHIISIIDTNSQRRQSIVRIIFELGWHAEPYESPNEFMMREPSRGIVMIEASKNQLQSVIAMLDEADVRIPVIGFSETPAPSEIVEAVLIGATGYLAWPFGKVEVVNAITVIGRIVQAGSMGEMEAKAERRRNAKILLATLTMRESQVLDQMLDGFSNREIGVSLNISPRTVEIHRHNLMRKLHARRAGDAVRIAMEAKHQVAALNSAAMFSIFDRISMDANSRAA